MSLLEELLGFVIFVPVLCVLTVSVPDGGVQLGGVSEVTVRVPPPLIVLMLIPVISWSPVSVIIVITGSPVSVFIIITGPPVSVSVVRPPLVIIPRPVSVLVSIIIPRPYVPALDDSCDSLYDS